MKDLIYKLLTQIIIIFGELRLKVEDRMARVIKKDRTFVFGPSCMVSCCDCGLTHLCWVDKKGTAQLAQPMRPKDYDYKFRRFAGKPSKIIPESELYEPYKDKWRKKNE